MKVRSFEILLTIVVYTLRNSVQNVNERIVAGVNLVYNSMVLMFLCRTNFHYTFLIGVFVYVFLTIVILWVFWVCTVHTSMDGQPACFIYTQNTHKLSLFCSNRSSCSQNLGKRVRKDEYTMLCLQITEKSFVYPKYNWNNFTGFKCYLNLCVK